MEMINTATFTDSFNPGFLFQTDLVKGEACEVKGHENGIEVSLYGIERNGRNTDQYFISFILLDAKQIKKKRKNAQKYR